MNCEGCTKSSPKYTGYWCAMHQCEPLMCNDKTLADNLQAAEAKGVDELIGSVPADTARLNWIEANFPKTWELTKEGSDRLEIAGLQGKTLREAIDNAMQKAKT